MGLDMYLYKKTYIGAMYEHREVKAKINITVFGNEKININPKLVQSITEQIGYWRKANAIHAWFVSNVQGGNDDCGQYHVPLEKLVALRDTCVKAKEGAKDKASELLPTQEGFFFGSTHYDEYYWQDIDETIEIMNNAISESNNHCNFYYQSSW